MPAYYREVYQIACPNQEERIERDMFVKILVKSSLPKQSLSQVSFKEFLKYNVKAIGWLKSVGERQGSTFQEPSPSWGAGAHSLVSDREKVVPLAVLANRFASSDFAFCFGDCCLSALDQCRYDSLKVFSEYIFVCFHSCISWNYMRDAYL